MANIIEIGGDKEGVGCLDPAASNYNPFASIWCTGYVFGATPQPDLGGVLTNGCCQYGSVSVTGCMDPQANNYNTEAVNPCDNCCTYGDTNSGGPILDLGDLVINPNGVDQNNPDTDTDVINCKDLFYTITNLGEITTGGVSLTEECCTYYESLGNTVSWNSITKTCNLAEPASLCETYDLGLIKAEELQQRVTCVDCDNFAWWDNLYTTINGDSLQNINTPLWDFLVGVITSNPTDPLTPNFGNGSFYIDILTGEPIVSETCCLALSDSNFTTNVNEFGEESSACLCDTTSTETIINCECLTDVGLFLSVASTKEGAELLLTPETLLSLGLSSDEVIFVINNAFNSSDIDGDDISESVKVKILLSNALAVSGGFYLCYEITQSQQQTENQGIPQPVSSTKCDELGGFFDGTLCFCKPQDDCNVSLTDITMTTIVDDFNQNLTIVTFNNESISQTCCLQIASDNNLPWSYESYNGEVNCFTSDPNPCLPLEFKLNRDLIKPECETPIDVSMSFYFGKPENPCVEIEDNDDDIIIIDNPTEPCLLSFDENNNIVDYNSTETKRRPEISQQSPQPISGETETPCCYNPEVPISVNLVIRDDKNNIIQTSDPFSFTDLETWFDITTQFTIPTTGTTEGFNAYLQFTSGLNCCCVYDIFLDNFKFNCNEELTITEIINNDCPGFDITPVIDNKKSWVYNPGELGYSEYRNQNGRFTDNRIITQGQYGLIEGYGEINRTFAPSLDAELEWRYTDYFKQSSVLEKHSNLVLNSKELFLTFDMCNIGGPCPNGYSLSAGTETCYKVSCPDGYKFSGTSLCYSASTEVSTFIMSGFTTQGAVPPQDLIDDNVALNPVPFNSFLTAGISTGSTVNIPLSGISYTIANIIDYRSLDLNSPPAISPTFDFFGVYYEIYTTPPETLYTNSKTLTQNYNPLACKTKFTLLELEGYKKTFQSFWVQFVEQFVPATTIFVSGERWCNRPDEICTQYDECDFDFEFVEGDVTTIPNNTNLPPQVVTSGRSKSYDANESDTPTGGKTYQPLDYESTDNGPIDTETVKIRPLPKENGVTTILPSTVDGIEERKRRKLQYQGRLQAEKNDIILE